MHGLIQHITSNNTIAAEIFFLIFFVAFLQRSLHRFFYPRSIEFDTCGHLFCANLLRENHLRIPKSHTRMIRPCIYPFPFLYHYFFAVFPKKWEPFLERHLNPFLDASFITVACGLILKITRSPSQALFCACAYIFTPVFFTVQKNGTRTKNATPRLFGEIMVNLTFLVLWFFSDTNDPKYYALAVFLGSLVFLSSKFSNQALTLIAVVGGITLQQGAVVALPLLSWMLAYALSFGKMLPPFKNQIDYLLFYREENQKGKMKAYKRNSLKTLWTALKSRSPDKIALQIFYRNSFSIVSFQFPLFWVALAIILSNFSGTNPFCAHLVLAATTIFLITNTGPFLFLGHAERYLNHVALFILTIVGAHLDRWPLLWPGVILYGLLFLGLDFLFLREKNKRGLDRDEEDILHWLKQQPNPRNILAIPNMLGGGWRIMYETIHNWFFHSQYDKDNREYWARIIRKHPFIEIDLLNEILNEGIDTIIVHESQVVDFYGKKFEAPPRFTPVHINKNVTVYLKS